MSTPTPESPMPDAARTDRRALYALAALVTVGIVVVVILLVTPSHHNTLVDGPINAPSTTGAAPAPSPTTTPTPTVASPSPARSTAAPVTSAPPTSAAPTPTSSPTPITMTAPATHNPAIPATLSPLEQSAALAYINVIHVENKVMDDNSSDMEVFNDIAEGGELKQLVDLITKRRGLDYVSHGQVRVTKIESVTLSQDQQTATVTACVDTSGITTVVEKTGEVVAHGSPPFVQVTYMHHDADGVWRTPGAPANQGGQSC